MTAAAEIQVTLTAPPLLEITAPPAAEVIVTAPPSVDIVIDLPGSGTGGGPPAPHTHRPEDIHGSTPSLLVTYLDALEGIDP